MALAVNPNPYVRSKRTTFSIMMELLIGLAIVWIASIVYYFTKGAGNDGLLSILNVVICAVVSFGIEILFFIPKWKKEEGHNFVSLMKKGLYSYGYISGMIIALVLPVMTNVNIGVHIVNLILTCVVSVGAFKMLFGGFGHNIFNVALVGRIFAQLCFGPGFVYNSNDLSVITNAEGVEQIINTGSTVLTNWAGNGFDSNLTFHPNYSVMNLAEGDNYLLKLLFGDYNGALGETFTLIILIVGVILAIRKVLDWKIPVFYLGTCFITGVLVGAVNGVNAFEFALTHLLTGGIAFGAVFCLTDPVTGPTNNLAKVVYAVFAGFLTMLIRIQGDSAEGVAYAILASNMIAPFIANFFKGRTTTKLVKKYSITGALCVLMILVSCSYSDAVQSLTYAGGATVTAVDADTYNVKIKNSSNSFGNLNMDVDLDIANRKVVSVTVLEEGTGATSGYGMYFFGVGDPNGDMSHYQPAKVEKLEGLTAILFTFDNGGISFDVFRNYDFEYWDAKQYKEFNDMSSDATGCYATYTVASYIYGVNAVIDAVEGK